MDLWHFASEGSLAGLVQAYPAFDYQLGWLACLLAMLGAIVLFPSVERIRAARSRQAHALWLASGAFAMGAGFWSMHWMAMLGFHLPVPVSYNGAVVALSLLPAVAGSAAAIQVLASPRPSLLRLHASACGLGFGLVVMHFSAMEALETPALMVYRILPASLAPILGYLFSLLALYVNLLLTRRLGGGLMPATLGSLILALAGLGVHYPALGATAFFLDPQAALGAELPAPAYLIPLAGLAMVLVVGVFWIGSLIDARLGVAMDALHDSEARSRAVVDTMPDAHIITDSLGRIRSFNAAAERIFGVASAQVCNQHITALIGTEVPHLQPEHWPLPKTVPTAGRWEFATGGRRRDGSLFPIEVRLGSFEIAGELLYTSIVRDLTDQYAADLQQRRLAAAVEHAADSIEILDARGNIVYVNAAYEARVGVPLAAIKGSRPEAILDYVADVPVYDEMRRTIGTGRHWQGVLRSRNVDGREFTDDTSVSPIRDAQGRISSYIVVKRDVAEKLELESQLARAQKLEAIGQLAAGIAHEINTPVQYVGDNIRFVRDAFAEMDTLLGQLQGLAVSTPALAGALAGADLGFLREEVPRALDQSADGCQRIATIVKAMKEFSHPGQEKAPVDLNRAIQSTITVASNEWKYVAEVRTEFDAALPAVTCLPGEFNQVILNMLVNAAHAIGDVVGAGAGGKGTITVSTRAVGEFAEIRISDTGGGITPEIRAKIFDPFFTTKAVGRGTGQGLAIAHDVIVNKHGGSIALESEPGKGATFIIRIPLMPPAGAQPTVQAA